MCGGWGSGGGEGNVGAKVSLAGRIVPARDRYSLKGGPGI